MTGSRLPKATKPSNTMATKNQAGGARDEKCDVCGACQEAKATQSARTCLFGTIGTARQALVSAALTVAASKAAQECCTWSFQLTAKVEAVLPLHWVDSCPDPCTTRCLSPTHWAASSATIRKIAKALVFEWTIGCIAYGGSVGTHGRSIDHRELDSTISRIGVAVVLDTFQPASDMAEPRSVSCAPTYQTASNDRRCRNRVRVARIWWTGCRSVAKTGWPRSLQALVFLTSLLLKISRHTAGLG